jgi:carbamoyltransferase
VGFGGPVSSVSALCEALVEAGAKVTVYTIAYDGKPPRREELNGVTVYYFRGDFGSPCQISRGLWKAVKKYGRSFDVAHLHTWWNVLIFRSLYLLKKLGVPAIISVRGMLSDYSFDHRKKILKRYFQKTTGVKLLKDVGLQATSEAEAEEMSRRSMRPLHEVDIIPNLLSFHHAAQSSGPKDGFVLGLLSRLHHKKGIDLLLEAVAKAPEVTKMIFGGTGSPEYEEWMRAEIYRLGIAHKVEFAGWITDENKLDFFQKIHVFILPSYNENFANVVAEAWSMAKPAIVSTGVGLQAFLEKYDAGWSCEPEVDSVADAIRKAWAEKDLWKQKGQSALQLVRQQLNGPQLLQAYMAMYEQKAFLKREKNHVQESYSGYILGLNAFHSDASAALYYNGTLIAASEEERFNRIKHWAGFPHEAIAFCLRQAGISLTDINHFALARDPRAKWEKKVKYLANNPKAISFALRGRLNNASTSQTITDELANRYLVPREFVQGRLHYIEHHRSHMASSFFASPFEEAAILSIDGSGDFSTTMMGVGRNNQVEVLQSVDFPHSLGIFYTAFTQLLGFNNYGDEYKVMGLAAYGSPSYARDLADILQLLPDGTFRLDLSWFRSGSEGYVYYSKGKQPIIPELFTQKMTDRFGAARQKDEPITQFHKDLAASVQHLTEQCIFHMLRYLHQQTGMKNICLAGGVAQNSVANGKITLQTPFDRVYVPPAGHDAGLALGAALWLQHQMGHQRRGNPLMTAFTGAGFSNDQIIESLQGKPVHFKVVDNFELLCTQVAAVIEGGGVVGWFRGRAEFGPRALGNRSILADPRRADAKELLNKKIKRREPFRPFAPAVLEEFAHQYFAISETTPFMEKVFPIRKEKQSEIPAVSHVDGTGRLQTVSSKWHPDFHKLIYTFFQRTGTPVLLNTSFNENEPIVNTPSEALDCFLRTKMDLLVMENVVVSRD